MSTKGNCDICDQEAMLFNGIVAGIETSYCGKCAGHDEVECPECDGHGAFDDGPNWSWPSIERDAGKVICPECKGDGWIKAKAKVQS